MKSFYRPDTTDRTNLSVSFLPFAPQPARNRVGIGPLSGQLARHYGDSLAPPLRWKALQAPQRRAVVDRRSAGPFAADQSGGVPIAHFTRVLGLHFQGKLPEKGSSGLGDAKIVTCRRRSWN
jgi:hypothetical protein